MKLGSKSRTHRYSLPRRQSYPTITASQNNRPCSQNGFQYIVYNIKCRRVYVRTYYLLPLTVRCSRCLLYASPVIQHFLGGGATKTRYGIPNRLCWISVKKKQLPSTVVVTAIDVKPILYTLQHLVIPIYNSQGQTFLLKRSLISSSQL